MTACRLLTVQKELHLNKLTVVSFDRLWSTSPSSWSVLGGGASLRWLEVSLVLPRPFEEFVLCAGTTVCSFWFFVFCFRSNRERPLQSTAPWLQSWRVSEGCTSTTASAVCPLRRPRTPPPPWACGNSARGSSRRDPPPRQVLWPCDPRRVAYVNVVAM